MADIETYSGQCPRCSRGMLQKCDPQGGGWFAFDACPWCGFAQGEGFVYCPNEDCEGRNELAPLHIWESLLQRHRVWSRRQLLEAHPEWPEFCQQSESEFWPSVFVPSTEFGDAAAPVYLLYSRDADGDPDDSSGHKVILHPIGEADKPADSADEEAFFDFG